MFCVLMVVGIYFNKFGVRKVFLVVLEFILVYEYF